MKLFDFLFGKKKKEDIVQEQVLGQVEMNRVFVQYDNYEAVCKKFIAFDTETTGLSQYNDEIVEVAAVKFTDGKIEKTYSSLIDPGISIPGSATDVNHITNEMIKKYGKKQAIAYHELVEFLGDAMDGETVICAHNASFDMGFLKKSLERYGYSGKINYVDTLSFSHYLLYGLPNYKQNTIAEEFGLVNECAH